MPVLLVPILISLGFFALVFGLFYMQKKENLAMLDKGMNPREFLNRPAPYKNLKWGLLLVGSGIGLLLAYVFDTYIVHEEDPAVPIYFALIAIGGGIGLILSYRIEKKELLDDKSGIIH